MLLSNVRRSGVPRRRVSRAAGGSRKGTPFTVTAFCGARCDPGNGLHRAAEDIGMHIATRGWQLVYGGGDLGLMGTMARSAIRLQGQVTAVIPTHIVQSERVAFPPKVRVVTTTTLRERKQLMDDYSDAFLALPGGIGTLEELAEVMTLRQLGMHNRRIVVLDIDDFWAPLRDLFSNMVASSLLSPDVLDYVEFRSEVDEAIAVLAEVASTRDYGV